MTNFPKTLHFMGTNQPVRKEYFHAELEVEGTIPADVQGSFFRAVPDPAFVPRFEDEIILSADGMVSCFHFKDGKASHRIKYVDTARHLAEKSAGKALFGKYRNPFTDDPSVEGVDRTLANTTPVWHAGQLFMTKEDGLGYEVNPHTLETIGRWDYGGKLKSATFTAHPRVDPKTGEMFFFGYESGGLATTDISYCIADKDGNLVSEQWFKAPYCASMHDFVITENYAIFPVFPTTADYDRIKDGGPHWAHQQELESWVGIMPRYGKVEEMRWFKGRKGVSAFHMINAFEQDGKIHMDHHLTETCAFDFMREAGGIFMDMQDIEGATTRWTFDMNSDEDKIEERPLGPPGDLPLLRDADQGQPYNCAYYLSMNPQGGPPVFGGPVGVMFNCLIRLEPNTGKIDMLGLGMGMCINEPVHIPSKLTKGDGWLMMVVDTQTGPEDIVSQVWIVDEGDLSAEPVAKIKMPVRSHAQVHGTWVSQEKLDNTKHP